MSTDMPLEFLQYVNILPKLRFIEKIYEFVGLFGNEPAERNTFCFSQLIK